MRTVLKYSVGYVLKLQEEFECRARILGFSPEQMEETKCILRKTASIDPDYGYEKWERDWRLILDAASAGERIDNILEVLESRSK